MNILRETYDAWLHAPAVLMEIEEERGEWIENRAHQMMQTGEDFDPYTPDNISEAISAIAVNQNVCDDLALFMPMTGTLADIGNAIKTAVNDYWHKLALAKAEREFDEE